MERVYGVVNGETVLRVDEAAKAAGLSRAQWIGKLIETALNDQNGENETEMVQLRSDLAKSAQDIARLNDLMASKDSEINYLRNISMALTLKIQPAIEPSQEEIKEKHWWQFWK